MSTRYDFTPGMPVLANVATEITAPGTVHCVEGDAGIGWLIVKLDKTSDDHPMLMSEYVHIPMDRCEPAPYAAEDRVVMAGSCFAGTRGRILGPYKAQGAMPHEYVIETAEHGTMAVRARDLRPEADHV